MDHKDPKILLKRWEHHSEFGIFYLSASNFKEFGNSYDKEVISGVTY